MTSAAVHKPSFWTVDRFRSWVEPRPNEERWELVDEVAISAQVMSVRGISRHTPLDTERAAVRR